MHSGKKSLAIGYAMNKKRKKMADGGYISMEAQDPDRDKGVHKPNPYNKGRSPTATHDKEFAKSEHKKVLREIKSMAKKDRKYLADGGEVQHKDAYSEFAQGVKDAFNPPKAAAAPSPTPEAHEDNNPVSQGMKKAFGAPGYAKGGFIEKEMASGYEQLPTDVSGDEYPAPQKNLYMEDEDFDDDMINRIMMSRGGVVANKDHMLADFEENQFDDLVKDDHLEEHYDGKNSGDEIGDHQEDEDRRDIVHRIMKSRAKKDRLPHPA